jgi:hypothetical protein
MGVHCESEKKVGESNWVEIVRHFVLTCLQYSSQSVKEGGINILSLCSFGFPSEFWSRISFSIAKYRLCAWAINLLGRSISSGHGLLSLTEDFSWHSIWHSC